jgi:hypothetical protein
MPVSWKWIELLRVVGVQLQFLTEFLRAHCGETVAWIEVPRGTLEELLEGSRRARSKARRCRGERDSRREALCPRDFDRLQQRGKCARIVLRQVAKNDPDIGVGLRQCLGNVAMLDAQPSPPRAARAIAGKDCYQIVRPWHSLRRRGSARDWYASRWEWHLQ